MSDVKSGARPWPTSDSGPLVPFLLSRGMHGRLFSFAHAGDRRRRTDHCAAACSKDSSTGSGARSIVGHVTINPGEARIPAESFVGHGAPLTQLALHCGIGGQRINVVFRSDALGAGRVGAFSVRTVARAREVGATIRARLASHPAASMFTVSDVSPTIGAARLRVRDALQRDALMAVLRADPAIASVSIDRLLSRGPESKKKLSQAMREHIRDARASTTPGAEGLRFANAFSSHIQYWNYNLIDAPRAWAIPDTGSATVTVAVMDDGINQHPDIAANLDMAGGYDFVSDDSDILRRPVPFCDAVRRSPAPTAMARPVPIRIRRCPFPSHSIRISAASTSTTLRITDCTSPARSARRTILPTSLPASTGTCAFVMVRVLGIEGFGYDFDVAQAVLYAAGFRPKAREAIPYGAQCGADHQHELGWRSDSTLGAAVAAAINAGSVIIASAGNDASYTPTSRRRIRT